MNEKRKKISERNEQVGRGRRKSQRIERKVKKTRKKEEEERTEKRKKDMMEGEELKISQNEKK